MSRCESILHPLEDGGCPGGHQSAGACYCDCHAMIEQCAICDEEHRRDDMIEVVDDLNGPPGPPRQGWICRTCRNDKTNRTLFSCSTMKCACGGDEHMLKVS